MKIPNKTAYSLDEALIYITRHSKEHGLTIKDLLDFAHEGKLKTVIRLTAERDFSDKKNDCRTHLFTINEKQLDSNLYLMNGDTEIKYNKRVLETHRNRKLSERFDRKEYIFFSENLNIRLREVDKQHPLMPRYPYEIIQLQELDTKEKITLNNIHDFWFSGFFVLEPRLYYGDKQLIINHGFIVKDSNSTFDSIGDELSLSFRLGIPSESKKVFRNIYPDFQIALDDIRILHKDLVECFDLDNTANNVLKKTEEIREELGVEKTIIDTPKNRISSPQKQLFALLVKKCYSGMDIQK